MWLAPCLVVPLFLVLVYLVAAAPVAQPFAPDAPPSLNLTSGGVSSSQPSASWKLPPTTPSYPYTGFKLEATQVVDQQSGWTVIQEKSMGEATEQSGWATVEFSIASVTTKLGAFDSTKSVSVRITLKNDAFGYGVPGAPARICLGDSNTTVALGSACLASSDQCPEGRKPSRAGASSCVPGPCPARHFGQERRLHVSHAQWGDSQVRRGLGLTARSVQEKSKKTGSTSRC